MNNILFTAIDWTKVEKIKHEGETGIAIWQTLHFDKIRIRIVEYSENYVADHCCRKGHIVHCLEGEFVTEQESGNKILLSKGMSYIVSDDLGSHRSISNEGAKLLIIDGDFLKS